MLSTYHHRPCGHHGPKTAEHCWHCKPERALENWPSKKRLIEEKKKKNEDSGTSTTTVVLHNNGGLANPLTSSDSHLLFSGNFFTPQIDLPSEDPRLASRAPGQTFYIPESP
ncbi:hypothetical protein B0T26DRAFT_792334, partial [Lasiosphaeria miniovina]